MRARPKGRWIARDRAEEREEGGGVWRRFNAALCDEGAAAGGRGACPRSGQSWGRAARATGRFSRHPSKTTQKAGVGGGTVVAETRTMTTRILGLGIAGLLGVGCLSDPLEGSHSAAEEGTRVEVMLVPLDDGADLSQGAEAFDAEMPTTESLEDLARGGGAYVVGVADGWGIALVPTNLTDDALAAADTREPDWNPDGTDQDAEPWQDEPRPVRRRRRRALRLLQRRRLRRPEPARGPRGAGVHLGLRRVVHDHARLLRRRRRLRV